MQGRVFVTMALALVAGLSTVFLSAKPATTLPDDFTDSLVTGEQGLAPTALAFPPDGRILIASRPGELRVYKNGALLGTPALVLKSEHCDNTERGLLRLAVDPSFDAQ